MSGAYRCSISTRSFLESSKVQAAPAGPSSSKWPSVAMGIGVRGMKPHLHANGPCPLMPAPSLKGRRLERI